jgi:hypothetical protein
LCTNDPFFGEGGRAGSSRSVPSFDHDLFRRTGLGFAKGRIYSVLESPMKAGDIASALGYKDARNVRLHLAVLLKLGLVRHLDDGRYARGNADLDAMANRFGVFGASDRQRARHRLQSEHWGRWYEAFEDWKKTGQMADPDTGEIVATESIPHKGTPLRTFRRRVLLSRARRANDLAEIQSRTAPPIRLERSGTAEQGANG